MSINWQLIKCAFGYHRFGTILHDDFLNRWIRICKACNNTIEIDAPVDENGDPFDSHTWLREQNMRDIEDMRARLRETRRDGCGDLEIIRAVDRCEAMIDRYEKKVNAVDGELC